MRNRESLLAYGIVLIFAVIGSFLSIKNEPLPLNSESSKLEIHFINVGQGDAILFVQGNNQVLIDGGPDNTVLTDLGKLMPVGDKKIEIAVLTHPHTDHLRGLNQVLQNYEIEKIYFNGINYSTPEYALFLSLINKETIQVERLFRSREIIQGDLRFETLWPPESITGISDYNDTSLAFLGNYGLTRFVLLGDVSTKAQQNFINGGMEPVDILKVSHHGSKTGTSEETINILKPQYSVITVGRNSYGHPAPTVLALLKNSIILRTDKEGTISFWSDKNNVFLY